MSRAARARVASALVSDSVRFITARLRTLRGPELAVTSVAFVAAYAMKRFYSHATPDDLAWILGPTGTLVTWVTSAPFVWEPSTGWVNTSLGVAITPACAGVNFLIVAWLTLTLGTALRARRWRAALALLFASSVASFLATLLVNTVRVVIAVHKHAEHRTEGVVLYLAAACVLHLVAQRVTSHNLSPATTRSA